MAHPVAIAVKRAKADIRLRKAIEAASETFGVEFHQSGLSAKRYKDLASAELVENVAVFLEAITTKSKASNQ